MITLGVAATEPGLMARAQHLADALQLPVLSIGSNPESLLDPRAILFVSPRGLYLQQTGNKPPGPVRVQFGNAAMRHRRRAGQNELLGRAVGLGKKSPLVVLDATAGLGKDSFVLADLGCHVSLCERHPLVFELLASGMEQAQASRDPWLTGVCQNMALLGGDSRELEGRQLAAIDVIYLDPMFPTRSKSARVKKDMALFQTLLEDADSTSDAEDLLLWALEQSVARVVVKRPSKAPVLADKKPSHVIAGKAVRYDVYVLRAIE